MPRVTPPDRREAILSAAREEFAARGFAAARLGDIARRVGISRPALYLQFDSKEAIFAALVGGLIADVIPQNVTDLADVPSAEGYLRAFIAGAFTRFTRSDFAFVPRIIAGEGQNFPELARFYYDQGIMRMLDRVEAALRLGVQRGEFACDDPHHAARGVVGGIILSAMWRAVFEPVGAEPLDIDAMARAHTDLVFNGLLSRKEPAP
ncbi:TetR/AcrR family transcriptional regulator [Novosphingobium sp. ZN18A2]|uniref:TetR/AcrR family transcriptional regulator n=1 Tax=Novosphingobium sp. ZN18A2 TaxID=3079861 RepID=UPI0030CB6961